MSFTSWLQGELKTRNWSISQFARRSRISDAHLSRLLAGTRKPGVEALSAIAKALELPVALVYQHAGLLPIQADEHNDFEQEWMHILQRMKTKEQRQELLELARFFSKQIQDRRKPA